MVTMSDVARRAGVSSATVSRVLNRSATVDAKTQALVGKAIAELRYRPNAVARGLASRSSRAIGVVINRFDSIYYGALLHGAEEALAAEGFKMLAESARERAEGERQAWESLRERQCDAVIVHSDKLDDAELAQRMEDHPRSVLMNRHVASHGERCVYLDNEVGGALAARYLHEAGHRRLAMITGPSSFYEARDRSRGFLGELARRGIDADQVATVEADFQIEGGRTAMLALLDGAAPGAVFAQNDEMAAGALEACRERGVQVPEDVSVLGFDDVAIARHLVPKLTTIRQPLAEIGAAAGRLALALATGTEPAEPIVQVFGAEVVERASVADLTRPASSSGRSNGRIST